MRGRLEVELHTDGEVSTFFADLTAMGLVSAGDIVLAGGRWRGIERIGLASGQRVHLVFVDGTEAVAERGAERYVIDGSADRAAA